MMMERRERYLGIEFDWFLIDGSGAVALCSSAGYGEVPASVFDGLIDAKSPMEMIDTVIAQLPSTGSHRTAGRGPGNCAEWRGLGDRGIYIYDWTHWKGPYERIVVPETPVNVTSFESELLRPLRPVVVNRLTVANTAHFQVPDLKTIKDNPAV